MRTNFRNFPYGAYLCENSIVYFDRRYRPIVRVGGGRVTVCDSLEWIEHSGQEWFYNDGSQPRDSAETRKILQNHMDAVPVMAEEVRRRNVAERRLRTLPPRRWSGEPHTVVHGEVHRSV